MLTEFFFVCNSGAKTALMWLLKMTVMQCVDNNLESNLFWVV